MTRTSAERVKNLQRVLWDILTRHGEACVANAVYSALLLTTTHETRWPLFSVVLELGAQSQSARALRDRVLPKLGCLLRAEEAPEALLKILAWLRSTQSTEQVHSQDLESHARAMVATVGRLGGLQAAVQALTSADRDVIARLVPEMAQKSSTMPAWDKENAEAA